jgi:hypothetical protein
MYAKFIPIFAVESFTGDYLNLEMFKIVYLLGVYYKDVYFCMIFNFVFFLFKRSMQIPIKIPTVSIQDIEYLTFSYIHGSWLFILWFHCGFCNKKGTFTVFTGFGHLQTSGRNMTVELDSRHPLLPTAGWGKSRFDSDLKKKNGNFCRYKCFQCWCKGENHENKQNYNC